MRRPAITLRAAVVLGVVAAAQSGLAAPADKPAAAATPAPAAVAEAFKHLAAGQKLLALKKFSEARAELEASFELDPQPLALKGIGEALRGEGRMADAYAALERALTQPGRPLLPYQRKDAEASLADLAKKTATIAVEVNEPDAAIVVDGAAVGASPRPGPIRLDLGAHKVTVAKAGFTPFETAVTLAAGDALKVPVTLAAVVVPPSVAIVTIREKSGHAADVAIDGLPLGKTPLQASVGPGTYHVTIKGAGPVGAPRELVVAAGDSVDLVLDEPAAPQPPPIVVAEPPCSTDSECASDARCDAGLCRKKPPALAPAAAGEACSAERPCAEGLSCTEQVCRDPNELPFAARRALSASWRVGLGLGGESSWVAPVHMLAGTFEVPLGRWVRYQASLGYASINGAKGLAVAPLGFGVPIPLAMASLLSKGIRLTIEPGLDALRVYVAYGSDEKDTVLSLGLWGRLVATRGMGFLSLVPIDLEGAVRRTTSNGKSSFNFDTSGWNYVVSLGVGVQL